MALEAITHTGVVYSSITGYVYKVCVCLLDAYVYTIWITLFLEQKLNIVIKQFLYVREIEPSYIEIVLE